MNLVFDKWDNTGNAIPNLSELDTKEQFALFPFFMKEGDLSDKMGMDDVFIKKCKVDEINLNEKFYYIISLRFSFLFCIKKGDIYLPKQIEEYIKNYNLKVIFLCELENHKYANVFIKLLSEKIKKNNWNEENFYIIDNNSTHDIIKEKFKTNINFFKINYLFYLLSKIENKMRIDNLLMDKKFIFLCHNREAHHHRILLLTHLKYNNLLKNDIINWSLLFNQINETSQADGVSITRFKDYIDINNKILVSDFSEMRKTKKICHYEKNSDIKNNRNDYNVVGFVTEMSYQNAYINIVTETHFIGSEGVHITEKSLKPFYYFQLPVFLSAYNHIRKLKDEYGFYLFDDLIDHSYDNEPNDSKRFHMIVNEIQRLSNMREEISNYYKNNVNKLIHNHSIIKNNKYEEVFKEYILNI